IATFIAAVLMTVLLVSFQPFAAGNTAIATEPSGPNPINQIGFSALGALALAGMLMLADRRRLAAAVDPAWLAVFACPAVSPSYPHAPADALRAVLFNAIVGLTCGGVLAIPARAEDFRSAATTAILIVLLLSCAGVLLMPSLAVHFADGVEDQHAGLWRGV